jgi:hypothetical protein
VLQLLSNNVKNPTPLRFKCGIFYNHPLELKL